MSLDTHIRVLPIHVANKIAAGEVVDRPASVVKELVENAFDAGATRIDVEITAGGRKLIAVRDNGSGMGRDDALLSVERQATSKIRDVDDIEHIATLGFRGEALAAIASVSRFRLTTCREGDDAGTELLITGGTVRDVKDTGCPVGTAFEVRDLFFNVPARRKFLRSHQTEMGHVRACFVVQALAHPLVGMSLRVDGRDTYALAGQGTLEDRLRELFGSDYARHLAPVNRQHRGVAVSGYASLPAFSRSDRNEQYVFVNGRATSAALINYAIREGYHTLLPDKRHPSVFLFVEMDPGLVDVNVHPTKKEVRFRKPGEVRDALIEAIKGGLQVDAPPAGPGGPVSDRAEVGKAVADRDVQLTIEDLPLAAVFTYPGPSLDPNAFRPPAPTPPSEMPQQDASTAPVKETHPPALSASSESGPWVWCRVLGQLGGLYVVLETEDGYVMMDPHAAHERVLFERYMADVVKGRVSSQALLLPESVDLQPRDAVRLRKHLDLFREMGFGISEFGGDTFVVDALPAYFTDTSATSILAEIAVTLERAGARGGKGRWREESVAQAACKSAVKARDHLRLQEMEKLVADLASCDMPYTCPHGRPTMFFTSYKDLNKKFGRE